MLDLISNTTPAHVARQATGSLEEGIHALWFVQWDSVEPYRRRVWYFEMTMDDPRLNSVLVAEFVTHLALST